ncbi:MAG: hypothetical protein ABI867_42565 [Kofleriaceae bacterium]
MRRAAVIVGLLAGCRSQASEPAITSHGWIAPATELGEVGQLPSELFEPATDAHRLTVQSFAAQVGGSWDIDLDPVLRTARSIRGSGLPVTGDLEIAAMAFVREHGYLFGTTELVANGTAASADVATISLAQRYHGLPVIGGHLGVTVSHDRLVLVQGTTYPIAALPTAPRIAVGQAVATVRGTIAAASVGDRHSARLVVLPVRTPGAVAYHLAWEVTGWRGQFQAVGYVDARDGELVLVYDADRYDYPGTATNRVEPRTVGDQIISVPAPYLRLGSTRGFVTTNATGAFTFPGETGPLTVSAQLRGSYADVRNFGGPNAKFLGMLAPDHPNEIVWNKVRSMPEERDVFHAVNTTNRYVATVFPNIKWMDAPVIANVNLQRTCNAFWNGTSINFFIAGNGCNNTGRIFDVIAHEWGHGFDQNAPGSGIDGALGEFIGDLISFVQTRSPLLGPGFFTNGKPARDLKDPNFQCYDPKKREVHAAGHLLGAVVWDIHEDLVAAGVTGEPLKRLMLLPIAIAQARSQWYAAMLAVDDNDGNLANGTPHECLIYNQFKAHSCGGTRWPGIPERDPPHCLR